jgi:hypothetical protein
MPFATIPHENILYTWLPSGKFKGFSYYLYEVRGSEGFGTVYYGARMIAPNGKAVGKYRIKIQRSNHIRVDSNEDKVSCDNESERATSDAIRKEISMMKGMKGCQGTSRFTEVFNQKMEGGVPINVCIVQPD